MALTQHRYSGAAEWSSLVIRRAHLPKVANPNLAPLPAEDSAGSKENIVRLIHEVGGPSAWKGSDIQDRTDWIVELADRQAHELLDALAAI